VTTSGVRSPIAEARAGELAIAGLVPLSTVDWPGRLVATVFCQGCPWRCDYCHNQAILDPRTPGAVPWADVTDLLARRRGLLDGVVFSGGEATMQHALLPAVRAVREAGFAVGLHTGGAFPVRLRALLGVDESGHRVGEALVDWVGFDVKASAPTYDATVGRRHAWASAGRSLSLLLASGVEHELRMTVTPGLAAQVPAGIRTVATAGGHALVLQRARSDGAPEAFAAQLAAHPDWEGAFTRAVDAARETASEHGIELAVR